MPLRCCQAHKPSPAGGTHGVVTKLARTVDRWLEAVNDAERRGELLTAVDLAEQGLAEKPDAIWLKHGAVLALARAGATDEAAARFERYRLAESDEADVVALRARIAKDLALTA